MNNKEAKKYLIKMDSPECVIDLINNTDDGLYETENEDGERVGVCVKRRRHGCIYISEKWMD